MSRSFLLQCSLPSDSCHVGAGTTARDFAGRQIELAGGVARSSRHVPRLLAPKASEVTLTGDWLGSAPPPKLEKDDKGIWSVTLGPLEPSIYIYSFNVDGVAIPDPVNPRIKLRARTSASMVEVSDDSAAFWQPRDVAHGKVEINWEKSKTINGETRQIWIYTPPGYDTSRHPYPVLYLLPWF